MKQGVAPRWRGAPQKKRRRTEISGLPHPELLPSSHPCRPLYKAMCADARPQPLVTARTTRYVQCGALTCTLGSADSLLLTEVCIHPLLGLAAMRCPVKSSTASVGGGFLTVEERGAYQHWPTVSVQVGELDRKHT